MRISPRLQSGSCPWMLMSAMMLRQQVFLLSVKPWAQALSLILI